MALDRVVWSDEEGMLMQYECVFMDILEMSKDMGRDRNNIFYKFGNNINSIG